MDFTLYFGKGFRDFVVMLGIGGLIALLSL